jgi:hypothetical protein
MVGQLLPQSLAKIDVSAWPRSATWQALDVATDLEAAAAGYRAAQRAVDDAKDQVRVSQDQLRVAREQLVESVIAAYQGGTRMRDLADITGLSRERLRQVLRAAGVEPY